MQLVPPELPIRCHNNGGAKMKYIQGTSNRYLRINLTNSSWSVYKISNQDRKDYLGGKGLALKIFHDLQKDKLKDLDPLGVDNILIFAMGTILSSQAPCSARFEVYSKSPLTGLLIGSSCGGPFGEACKTAGWDGVILEGKAENPSLIKFGDTEVEFLSAHEIWGKGIQQTEDELLLSVREKAVIIGPAGENLNPMANIRSGHRFAGRGGLGAVMGSKNVKALVSRGFSHQVVPVNPPVFNKAVKTLKRYIHRSEFVKAYRLYGTNANVRFGIKSGFSPVRNFKDRYDNRIERTSGETMAKKYNTRSSSCKHCSINCGHKGHFKNGKLHQIPEYETNGMFGSNIENYDTDLIIEWNDQMNDLGLDTISVGGTLAWAMEAAEKGLRKSELRFGKTSNISSIIHDIALRQNEGQELCEGSRYLSQKYGGEDFAIQTKGLEIAAYDPRAGWGQGLGYAVGNKGGDHLTSYMIGIEVIFKFIKPHSIRGKAKWTIFFEDLFASMNSLQICQFTAYGFLAEYPVPKYIPLPILRPIVTWFPGLSQFLMSWKGLNLLFTGLTGIPLSQKGFIDAGRRINLLERQINEEMNPQGLVDSIPLRFQQEKNTKFVGDQKVIPIEKLVQEYKRLRSKKGR